MAFKIIILCASALMVKTIAAQCLGNAALAGLAGNGLGLAGNGLGLAANGYLAGQNLGYGNLNQAALSNGGGFSVTSVSPIAPTGISVLADNLAIEGIVDVGGNLPLLSVVALEGAVPTGGQAGASYGCGNGNVGIINEIGVNSGLASPVGIGAAGLGAAGLPLGAGLGAAGLSLGPAGLGLGNGLGACGRII